jgi:Reverse transcriptase (RNA-dependent DNA polymerase)
MCWFYVDDIVITGNNSTAISSLIQALHTNFSIKDLGDLNYFLGIEVCQQSSGLHLSQQRYLTSILQRAAMDSAKPCKTPMQLGQQLSKFSGTVLSNPQQY